MPITDAISSELVLHDSLERQIRAGLINHSSTRELEARLAHVQTAMKQTYILIWDIARTVYRGHTEDSVYNLTFKDHNDIKDWDCYEKVVDTLLAACPYLDISTNDFALHTFYALVNLCNKNPQDKIIRSVKAISDRNPLCHA